MRLVVNLGETLKIEMGVHLGGAQIGMAEQFLHCAQITAGFQQVGGKGMAQGMWMQAAVKSLFEGPAPETLLHIAGADACASAVNEQGWLALGTVNGADFQPAS